MPGEYKGRNTFCLVSIDDSDKGSGGSVLRNITEFVSMSTSRLNRDSPWIYWFYSVQRDYSLEVAFLCHESFPLIPTSTNDIGNNWNGMLKKNVFSPDGTFESYSMVCERKRVSKSEKYDGRDKV